MQNAKAFVLVLHGPPDAGQVAVANLLMKGKKNRFLIFIDQINFLISDYSVQKTSSETVNKIAFAMAPLARAGGLSLIINGSLAVQKTWWKSYQELAQETGAVFVEVNIEASFRILRERFLKRVRESQANGIKVSISHESELRDRCDRYRELKKQREVTKTFNSSISSPETIARRIENLLSKT